MPVDPVQQSSVWMQDYGAAFNCRFAIRPPAHSIAFAVVKATFDAGYKIEDLEKVLQGMIAEKKKPPSYPWMLSVIKGRLEDMAHERTSSSEAAS